jgi:hypothetical protein
MPIELTARHCVCADAPIYPDDAVALLKHVGAAGECSTFDNIVQPVSLMGSSFGGGTGFGDMASQNLGCTINGSVHYSGCPVHGNNLTGKDGSFPYGTAGQPAGSRTLRVRAQDASAIRKCRPEASSTNRHNASMCPDTIPVPECDGELPSGFAAWEFAGVSASMASLRVTPTACPAAAETAASARCGGITQSQPCPRWGSG